MIIWGRVGAWFVCFALVLSIIFVFVCNQIVPPPRPLLRQVSLAM